MIASPADCRQESPCLPIHLPSVQGKGCGFVQFVLRTAAERAMATMNGQVLGAGAMRISWGRSSSRVANQAAQQGGMAGHFGMHGKRRDVPSDVVRHVSPSLLHASFCA